MRLGKMPLSCAISFCLLLLAASLIAAPTPSPALLVVIKDEHKLAVVDPSTKQVVTTIPCGDDPHEVAVSPDGKIAYLSNFAPFVIEQKPGRAITMIDLVAQKQLRQLDIGPQSMPHGLLVVDGKLYFTAQGFKLIGRYDPAIDKIDWMMGTSQFGSHLLVMTKDKKAIYSSNGRSNSVSVFETAPGLPPWNETVIPVGMAPEAMDISPDGKEVWTATGRDSGVSIIDVASKKVVQTLKLDMVHSNRLKFTLDGKWVLISDSGGGAIIVLDAARRKDIKHVSVGKRPEGIQMAPDGQHVYVAVSADNNVAIIDLKTYEITGRILTGADPDGMAWVAGR
jgi:YVTN family beta-propeller protein